jgi:hypothetical protein
MFQSESLQEKWKPLLEYEGLDPIKDNHRKAVTAVLLEKPRKIPQRGTTVRFRSKPDGNCSNKPC